MHVRLLLYVLCLLIHLEPCCISPLNRIHRTDSSTQILFTCTLCGVCCHPFGHPPTTPWWPQRDTNSSKSPWIAAARRTKCLLKDSNIMFLAPHTHRTRYISLQYTSRPPYLPYHRRTNLLLPPSSIYVRAASIISRPTNHQYIDLCMRAGRFRHPLPVRNQCGDEYNQLLLKENKVLVVVSRAAHTVGSICFLSHQQYTNGQIQIILRHSYPHSRNRINSIPYTSTASVEYKWIIWESSRNVNILFSNYIINANILVYLCGRLCFYYKREFILDKLWLTQN